MSNGILHVPGNRTSCLDGLGAGFIAVACSADVSGYDVRIFKAREPFVPFVDESLFSMVYLQPATKKHLI